MVMRWIQDPSVRAIMHVLILVFGLLMAMDGERLGAFMAVLAGVLLVLDLVQLRRRRARRRENLHDVDLTP